jgi:RNA polymerase sigma factor (sigma-70 family)
LDLLRRKDSTYEKLDENFGSDTRPHEQLERKERVKALIEQISLLPERQRGAIVLQELAGHSTDEVAAELGVRNAVVGQLVYRARQQLRKAELGPAGP